MYSSKLKIKTSEGVSADGRVYQTVWYPVPYHRAGHRKSPLTVTAETIARLSQVRIL